MSISKAVITDIPELNQLINSAYRGDTSKQGWTTESDLLDGLRIDEDTLKTYFEDPNVSILKNVDDDGKITGSVYLEVRGNKLYVGMFSVSPLAQNKRIGRTLLLAAEDYARLINCIILTMTVISVRTELISWYERRGFKATGEILPFHVDEKFGVARQHIELMVLEKELG